MSAESKSDIEAKSKTLEDKSGIQLVVATVKSLQGSDIETYANQLARFWKPARRRRTPASCFWSPPASARCGSRSATASKARSPMGSRRSSSSEIIPRFKNKDFPAASSAASTASSACSRATAPSGSRRSMFAPKARRKNRQDLPLVFTVLLIFFIWYLIRNAGSGRPPGPGSRSGPIIFPGGWGIVGLGWRRWRWRLRWGFRWRRFLRRRRTSGSWWMRLLGASFAGLLVLSLASADGAAA